MPNDIHVRRIDPADPAGAEALLDLDQLVWSDPLKVPREESLRHVPTRAGFLATIDGEDIGVAGSWDVEVSVPATGGAAALRPTEGLTWVGVHPDFRRRGVLTALIRTHLRWTRDEAGRTLAALKASEPSIYGRFGYGVASSVITSVFSRGTDFAAPEQVCRVADATTTRMTTAGPEQAERLHAVLRAGGATAAGHVVRSEYDLRRNLTDIPQTRGNREPARLMWATRDGQDVGAAYFHRTEKWGDRGAAQGRVGVFFLVATDPGARLALARRLTDLDLMSTTEFWVAPDDPLALWQPSLRAIEGGMSDSLWVRVVDLPGAVAERGHAVDLDLTVRVRDDLLPENARTWRWTATGGVGRLAPTDDPADLSLDIGDLGGVWLGGQTVAARAAAGYVIEHRAGAVAELDAALRTPTLPVASIDF